MRKLKLMTLTMAALVIVAGCSVDLGSRDRAPDPEYGVPHVYERDHHTTGASWCCAACESGDDGVATCQSCRREGERSCRANETVLACRSSYTEERPGVDATVTCF